MRRTFPILLAVALVTALVFSVGLPAPSPVRAQVDTLIITPPAAIVANDVTTGEITVTLTGPSAANATIDLTISGDTGVTYATTAGTGTVTTGASTVTANGTGVFKFTARSATAPQTITVVGTSGTATDTKTFDFTAAVVTTVTLALSKASIVADNVDSSTITVEVRDQANVPMNNVAVTINAAPPPVGVTFTANGNTNASGQFTTPVTSNKVQAGGAPIAFTATAGAVISAPQNLAITPSGIALAIVNNNQPANDTSLVSIEVTVTDASGPVQGVTVGIYPTGTDVNQTFSPPSTNAQATDALGKAIWTVRSKTAMSFTVFANTASLPNTPTSTVTFIAQAATTITIAANPLSVVSDNTTKSLVTVEVRDQAGVIMPNASVAVSPTFGGGLAAANVTYSAGVDGTVVGGNFLTGTTGANGRYSFNAQSNLPGTLTLNATSGSATTGTAATITFTPQTPAAITITTSATSVPANNTTNALITVEVRDGSNLVINGADVTITPTFGGGLSAANVTYSAGTDGAAVGGNFLTGKTGTNGRYSFNVRSNLAGTATFSATSGAVSTVTTVTVTFTSVTPVATSISILANPVSVAANNTAKSLVTVQVLDQFSVGLPGALVTISPSFLGGITAANVTYTPGTDGTPTAGFLVGTTGANGRYSFYIQSNLAGIVTFSAVTGALITPTPASVIFSSAAAGQIQILLQPSTIPADNTALATFTITITDVNNLPLAGQSVTIITDPVTPNGVTYAAGTSGTAVGGNFLQGITGADGKYIITIKSTTAGSLKLSALYGATTVGPLTLTFSDQAVQPDPARSTVYCNYTSAPVNFEVLMFVQVKSSGGTTMANRAMKITISPDTKGLSIVSASGQFSTDGNGVMNVSIRSSTVTSPGAVNFAVADEATGGSIGSCAITFTKAGTKPIAASTPVGGLTGTLVGAVGTTTPVAGVVGEGDIVGTVVAFSLRIRGGPGTDFPILGTVPAGTKVAILGRNAAGNWYFVRLTDGSNAWMSARWIRIRRAEFRRLPVIGGLPGAPALLTATAPDLPGDNQAIGRVTAYLLRGRGGPSLDAQIIGVFQINTRLLIIGRTADRRWYRVVYNGGEAWVNATYIRIQRSKGQLPVLQ